MIHKEAKIGSTTKIWHEHLSNIGNCTIGEGCVVHSNVWIGDGVVIGNNVKIQAFTFIPDGVVIEDNVFIAPHVCFTNDPQLEIKGKGCWKGTLIKNGAKIGANACIKAGVTIGENAVIGMGSVVIKDVNANEVWVGNPARRIK